jgi:hypothetical protein
MVWLQMPFLYFAFYLACQIPKYCPKVSPKLTIQHFANEITEKTLEAISKPEIGVGNWQKHKM